MIFTIALEFGIIVLRFYRWGKRGTLTLSIRPIRQLQITAMGSAKAGKTRESIMTVRSRENQRLFSYLLTDAYCLYSLELLLYKPHFVDETMES